MWENVQSGDFGPKIRNLEKTAKLKSPVSPVHSGDFGYTLMQVHADVRTVRNDQKIQVFQIAKSFLEI